jgi:hypothetical protein
MSRPVRLVVVAATTALASTVAAALPTPPAPAAVPLAPPAPAAVLLTPPAPAAAAVPRTIVLDGAQLVTIRKQLSSPSPQLAAALAALRRSADSALTAGPWSVMDKKTTVSKNKHDYYSLATYFWPNPNTADHCPYVRRDGQPGPDVLTTGDLMALQNSWRAIPDLVLAWFYTGDARYAARAELDIRTWFLNSATRMNPNMNFGQVVPCTTAGRKEGIIETSEQITQVIDALAVLDSGAPGWTGADRSGMVSWLTQFLTWSRTSSLGKAESKATNNHGTFKDLQDAVIARYVGQTGLATSLIKTVRTNRIAKQIASDGSQPGELSRTRPWHYSNFNLQALCRLAEAARTAGIDLWRYTAPGGGGLKKAADFLIPAAEQGASAWKYHDLDPFDQSLALDKLHAAAVEGHDAKAQAALAKVPAPPSGDLWPLEPACWQDLSFPAPHNQP